MASSEDDRLGRGVSALALEPLEGEPTADYARDVWARLQEFLLKPQATRLRQRLQKLNPTTDAGYDDLFGSSSPPTASSVGSPGRRRPGLTPADLVEKGRPSVAISYTSASPMPRAISTSRVPTARSSIDRAARDPGLRRSQGSDRRPGRERGFVTSEDLLEAVPVDDFTPEQVEEFLTQVEEHLRGEGIEVIEVPGDDSEAATQVRIEVDLLKAPTNDPVRMYLKEIGKVPLLTPPRRSTWPGGSRPASSPPRSSSRCIEDEGKTDQKRSAAWSSR